MSQPLIAFDQLLNTVVWVKGDGFGYADETLSARAWRLRETSKAWRRIDAIFFWETGHCQASYESEWQRKQLPTHYHDV
jgi:hypothetical protein